MYCELWSSFFGSSNMHYFWPCVGTMYYSLLFFPMVLPRCIVIFSYVCTEQYSTKYIRGTICRSPESFFSAAISSLGHCTWMLTVLALLDNQIFNSWKLPSTSPSLSALWPRNFHQEVSLANYGAPLLCLHVTGFIILCCLMSNVLSAIVYIFCPVFKQFYDER